MATDDNSSTTTPRRPITVDQAVHVLFQHRHTACRRPARAEQHLPCASAVRYGEPYERRDPAYDAAFCRDHDTAECERENA